MLYIPFENALKTLLDVLNKLGFEGEDSRYLADVFARNTLEGVYSHGINRFPRFVESVQAGSVSVAARPVTVGSLGGMEVWDGQMGPGPLIARDAMKRACELARTHGIACVSVRNSNHWQRAGRYGQQAAQEGMIGVCWTNTAANMPAWGAKDAQLGNNPFVIAIPRKKGNVVMDLSMSQFAYGKLEVAALEGKQMPIDAGYDEQGQLTRDPKQVLKTGRILPMGYWKGSSLSLMLDMVSAGISLGRTTHAIGAPTLGEKGLSQVFIAIHYAGLVNGDEAEARFDDAVDALLASAPADEKSPVRYPSQNISNTVERNLQNGLPINESTWAKVLGYLN